MVEKNQARKVTIELIEKAECGTISWEDIARGCLNYMSEADVKDMAESECLIDDSEDDV